MIFAKLAAERRSTREFSDRKVEQSVIDRILEITLTAPSAKNTKSTRIAYTDNGKMLSNISKMRTTGSTFVADAPLAFIVMADESLSDLWLENCAISATTLQFAAQSLGLKSCWVHVNGRPNIAEEPDGKTAQEHLHKHIPATKPYRIECVIAVGYSDKERKPHDMTIDPQMVIKL